MTMAITPIIGTLAYILDQESDRVLLIRRDSRPDDDHFGKVNGLGGKVEKGEKNIFMRHRKRNCRGSRNFDYRIRTPRSNYVDRFRTQT